MTKIKNAIVFCDFDGTITLHDTFYKLLSEFASKNWYAIEEEWKKGLIGSKECTIRQLECIDYISQSQLDKFIETIEIDPFFKNFLDTLKFNNTDFYIVSDGFTYIIEKILKKNNLSDIKIIANNIEVINNKFLANFPYSSSNCFFKNSNCKCNAVKTLGGSKYKIYIGDGHSDKCAVKHADLVFAKNELANYCIENNINFENYKTFNDISTKLFIEKEIYANL